MAVSAVERKDFTSAEGELPQLRGSGQVLEIRDLTDTIYALRLHLAEFAPAQPGQFINLEVPGYFLRRPLAIANLEQFSDGSVDLTVIVAQVGAGTRTLREVPIGTQLSLLGPLGNGFAVENLLCTDSRQPVLIGGGSGIPPLYYLAKELTHQGLRPQVYLGFRRANAVYYQREFAELGCDLTLATEDGSCGITGFVTSGLPEDIGTVAGVYACGPTGMLRSVKAWLRESEAKYTAAIGGTVHAGAENLLPPAQLSLEAHMGCGFGACLGCAVHTVRGLERVCVEGPVFAASDVLFADEQVRA